MKKILAVLALFLTIFVSCSASSLEQRRILETAAAETGSDNCLYALFDAGSSSLKARLYEWPCRKTSTIPDLKLIAPIGDEPGFKAKGVLNTLKTEADLQNFLKPFFDAIAKKLTTLNLNVKPFIFLRGTAGLRLLSIDEQKQTLSLVRSVFRKNTNFVFLDDEWARVISGEDEGTFLWISVNYALKNIKSDNKSALDLTQSASVIDIGGASVQIAFADSTNNNKFLDLASKNRIKIYSETFLSLGNDETRDTILQDNDHAYCFSKFSDNTNYSFQVKGTNINFAGDFNFDKCINLIVKFLKIDGCTYPLSNDTKDCSALSTYNKKLINQKLIYGVSSLYFAMNNIFNEVSKTLTLSAFRAKSKEYCETQLTSSQISGPALNNIVFTKCFQAMYVTTLLIDGFGLIDKEIQVMSTLNSFTLDWSIGSLIYDVNSLQCDYMDVNSCTITELKNSENASSVYSSIVTINLLVLLWMFI